MISKILIELNKELRRHPFTIWSFLITAGVAGTYCCKEAYRAIGEELTKY